MNFSAVDFNPYKGTDKSLIAEIKFLQCLQDFSSDNAIPLAACPNGFASCPSCGFNKVSVVSMAKGSTHHAAFRCGQCDRFLGWQPKPESQEKRLSQQVTINQLLKSPQLSQWEREFLTSVQGKRSLSPKQLAVVQKIEAKLGGEG